MLRRSREFLVFQNRRFDEFHHRIAEQVGVVPVIETPRHFIKVGLQMLRADLMPRTDDAALQERECGLDAVRGDAEAIFVAHVLLVPVVDDLVRSTIHDVAVVAGVAVGNEYFNVSTDVLADVLSESPRAGIRSVKETEFTVALFDSDDYLLVLLCLAASVPSVATADIGFVHLDHAVHLFGNLGILHRGPDTVAEIPRCLIADSQSPLDLVGAHALAGLAEQVGSKEPLPKREVGVVKDCASRHRKLVAAVVTIVLVALHDLGNLLALAARAGDSTIPTKRLKVSAAAIFAPELFNQFAEIHGIRHG